MKTFRPQLVEKSVPAAFSALLTFLTGVFIAVTLLARGGAAQTASMKNGYGALVGPDGSSPFVAVAERMLPAVVYIESTGELDPSLFQRNGDGSPGIPDDETHRGLPGSTSSGSGVIVSTDGLILTNNHVVDGATDITVNLSNGEKIKARVLGIDPETDLAVLKVDRRFGRERVATFGNSDQLKIGDWAIALGSPYGLQQSLTVGVISAKGRSDLNISGGAPVFQDFIQTDASINLGNSGGPLANIRGELIGINTAINAIGQGIGFAIPVNMAKRVFDQITQQGRVVRGYLGMSPGPLEPEIRSALRLPGSVRGIVVLGVEENSPAARGRLRPQDVITEWNGSPIQDVADFRLKVAAVDPGKRVKAKILRSGRSQELEFVLEDRADHITVASDRPSNRPFSLRGQTRPQVEPEPAPDLPQAPRREERQPETGGEPLLGLEVQPLGPDLLERFDLDPDALGSGKGVLITGFTGRGPARKQLKVGDLIFKIDRYRVNSIDDFRRAASLLEGREGAILYHIIRDGRSTIIPVKP